MTIFVICVKLIYMTLNLKAEKTRKSFFLKIKRGVGKIFHSLRSEARQMEFPRARTIIFTILKVFIIGMIFAFLILGIDFVILFIMRNVIHYAV